jgi:hypothetical protein
VADAPDSAASADTGAIATIPAVSATIPASVDTFRNDFIAIPLDRPNRQRNIR